MSQGYFFLLCWCKWGVVEGVGNAEQNIDLFVKVVFWKAAWDFRNWGGCRISGIIAGIVKEFHLHRRLCIVNFSSFQNDSRDSTLTLFNYLETSHTINIDLYITYMYCYMLYTCGKMSNVHFHLFTIILSSFLNDDSWLLFNYLIFLLIGAFYQCLK